MCFSSSSPEPVDNPAPYSLKDSYTAVKETEAPANKKTPDDGLKATASPPAQAPAPGLTINGM